MKSRVLVVALMVLPALAACAEQPECPVWFVAEEVDTGTAQQMTVALERALEADTHFTFADAPGQGTATFVLKRAALAARGGEQIEMTYEVTDHNRGRATRRVLNCEASGHDCMTTVLGDLRVQCALGA